jgi:hypothetical protein
MPVSRVDTLQPVIRAIIDQDWTSWNFVAVGQGNLDDPRKQQIMDVVKGLSEEDPRVHYHHTKSIGASAGRNAGIAQVHGDIIALLDDDCVARSDWLSTIAQYFEDDPTVGLVGGAVIAPPNTGHWFGSCPDNKPSETIYDPSTMKGCPPEGWSWISANMAIRRKVIEIVGPWDEFLGPGTFFPVGDDTDYKFRLEAAGIKMAVTPRSVVHHTYGYRTGIRAVLDFQNAYAYGNGAFAGKLTLMGDRRGMQWMEMIKKETYQLSTLVRPHQLLRTMRRWKIFKQGYERCIQNFRVSNNLLQEIG